MLDTQTVHGAKTVYMLDTLRQFMVQRQCTCWTNLDSSWCKEETVKNLNCTFECHFYYPYYTITIISFFRHDSISLVDCSAPQQQTSVSQGRISSDDCTCCQTEIEVQDQTFYLTQSQYTDTRPTSPSADPITPGAWQGSHWSANF